MGRSRVKTATMFKCIYLLTIYALLRWSMIYCFHTGKLLTETINRSGWKETRNQKFWSKRNISVAPWPLALAQTYFKNITARFLYNSNSFFPIANYLSMAPSWKAQQEILKGLLRKNFSNLFQTPPGSISQRNKRRMWFFQKPVKFHVHAKYITHEPINQEKTILVNIRWINEQVDHFMIDDKAKCFSRKINKKRRSKKVLRIDKHFCRKLL